MNEIKIEVIEPREPSIELILEMIDDASKQKNPSKYYIRQQLADLIIVKKLIDLGAHVNPKGLSTTPLLYAAQGESEDSSLNEKDQKTQMQIIDLLLENGAKLNYVDDGGDTALTNAVRCNHILIVKHLIEKGINELLMFYFDLYLFSGRGFFSSQFR